MTKTEVKETGNDIIDNYTDALYDLTDNVVDNGEDLNSLIEGVKSGAVSELTALTEATALSDKITSAATKAKSIATTVKSAA